MFDRGLILTLQAIRRQLGAMPCELYLIRLIHQHTGRPFPGERLWTAAQLANAATVRFLRIRNLEGCDVYIQPYANDRNAGYILVDLDRGNPAVVETMRANGHQPCVVLETSPGHFQAWTRLSAFPLEPAVATAAGKQLAHSYGGDWGSTDWRHLGRLAGFTCTYSPNQLNVLKSSSTSRKIMRRRRIRKWNRVMNANSILTSPEGFQSTESFRESPRPGRLRAVYVRDGQFPIHVIRTDGLPEIPLTAFASELFSILSASSVPGYVRELLQFVNWARQDAVALAQRWDIYSDPPKVRNAIREYLTVAAKCRITVRPDTLGLRAAYINASSQTRINVRLLLASLKKLYDVLGDRGFYPFPNPMVHEDAARTVAAFHRGRREAMRNAWGRSTMPAVSGVDEPPSDLRLSQNYFRLVNTEWVPKSIDDPDFPSQVYAAGKEYGWSLPEICAARTLFESGARISEVFDLTAADWSVSQFMNRFSARSKGSYGQRIKTLVVSQATAKLYRRYFNDKERGRLANDPDRITTAELNNLLRRTPKNLEGIRIYLTGRGTSMSAGLFRDYYWKPALRAAGIDADHTLPGTGL